MLLLMMETKGKFQNKIIKKARFGDQHFDENQNFLSHEKNVRSPLLFSWLSSLLKCLDDTRRTRLLLDKSLRNLLPTFELA